MRLLSSLPALISMSLWSEKAFLFFTKEKWLKNIWGQLKCFILILSDFCFTWYCSTIKQLNRLKKRKRKIISKWIGEMFFSNVRKGKVLTLSEGVPLSFSFLLNSCKISLIGWSALILTEPHGNMVLLKFLWPALHYKASYLLTLDISVGSSTYFPVLWPILYQENPRTSQLVSSWIPQDCLQLL